MFASSSLSAMLFVIDDCVLRVQNSLLYTVRKTSHQLFKRDKKSHFKVKLGPSNEIVNNWFSYF